MNSVIIMIKNRDGGTCRHIKLITTPIIYLISINIRNI